MTELKFFAEFKIPEKWYEDEFYDNLFEIINERLENLAEDLNGKFWDLEVK